MSRGRSDKDITMDSSHNSAVKSSPQVQQLSSKSLASIFSSPSSTTTTINTQRMRNANDDGGARGSGSSSNSRDRSRVNHQSSTAAAVGMKRPFNSVDNSPAAASDAPRDQLQQQLGSAIGHYHAIRSPDSIHPADAITPSSHHHHHHFNRGTALAAAEVTIC